MKRLTLLLSLSCACAASSAQEPDRFTREDGVSLREYLEHRDNAQKEYFDQRLTGSKEYYEIRFLSMEKAVATAQSALDKRLDGMNEFRSTLKDQSASFITRAEHAALEREIQDLRESRAELTGKASQTSVLVAYILSALGLLVSVVEIFIRRPEGREQPKGTTHV